LTNEPTYASTLFENFRRGIQEAHSHVLRRVEDLSDEQLTWRPGHGAPSIGFHVWHLARWADHDLHQADGSPQLWRQRGLAAAWGFPSGLGEDETGTEMGDDASERLVLPGKALLLDYTGSIFSAVDEFLGRLSPDALLQPVRPGELRDGQIFLELNLAHDNRHLGMIEAVRGLLGLRGTATR
jgi:hypothetical protein